jgi:hypothetical protein
VPLEDEAPTRSMTFPPRLAYFPLSVFTFQLMVTSKYFQYYCSQNLEPEPTTSKKRKSVESNSGPAGR